MARFFPDPSSPSTFGEELYGSPIPPRGLPKRLLVKVLEGVLGQIKSIQNVVQTFEWRVRGGSVLILYEGDQAALESALAEQEAGEAEEDEDDEDEEDGVKQPFLVRLIDFAHAREGVGVDEGYNLGLVTLLSLVEARLSQVRALADD
jgi:1D-myo-inositol-tetrakisphosphate 5-kinase/inositol-polyphosphate multikinase